MATEDKKYEKVLNILRKSNPVFKDAEAVSEIVFRKLQEQKSNVSLPELIFDYLFGWVYIGWVRRSMVAATLVIVVLFGYQQALILKRIDGLSGQRIQTSTLLRTNMTDDLTNKILLYRISGRKISDEKVTVSEKEIDEMIRSINKLQVKYKDLFNLIENDPKLKKYLEDRLFDSKKDKI